MSDREIVMIPPATSVERNRSRGQDRIRIPWVAIAWWMVIVAGPANLPATAQYTPPGSVAEKSEIPAKETMEENYADARWKAGPVKLNPWLGIRDASFVSTTSIAGEPTEEDFTVTLGAGLRAYLKTGSRLFLSAQALPEYVWWQDLASKERFNGRYGLGVFGYFNRLTFELSGRQVEEQGFFSSEIQELTSTRRDSLRAAFELEVARRLSVFGLGRREELDNQEDENDTFSLLDREDEIFELGLRYRSSRGYWLELAHEERASDFAPGARNFASSGTAERLGFGLEGPRLEFRLQVADYSLAPEAGSEFRGFDDTTGSLDVLWKPRTSFSVLAYARRDFSYSASPEFSHFLGERRGIRGDLRFRAGILSLYGELGDDDFEALSESALVRLDDVEVVGAELQLELRKLATLILRFNRTQYDSNLDAFDRDVTQTGLVIALGGIIERLSLGSSRGQW